MKRNFCTNVHFMHEIKGEYFQYFYTDAEIFARSKGDICFIWTVYPGNTYDRG